MTAIGPTLETARLVLRPPIQADVDGFAAMATEEATATPWKALPRGLSQGLKPLGLRPADLLQDAHRVDAGGMAGCCPGGQAARADNSQGDHGVRHRLGGFDAEEHPTHKVRSQP